MLSSQRLHGEKRATARLLVRSGCPGQKPPGRRFPPLQSPPPPRGDGEQSWQCFPADDITADRTSAGRRWQRPTSSNHLSTSTFMLRNTSSPVRGFVRSLKREAAEVRCRKDASVLHKSEQKVTLWIGGLKRPGKGIFSEFNASFWCLFLAIFFFSFLQLK